jgi:hypothetical protein
MSWEGRWRELVLARGAVAVAACTSTRSGVPCCNANGDPCCEYQYCGAPLTPACSQKMACEADGGTWDYGYPNDLEPTACAFPSEAGLPDGPAGDAALDSSLGTGGDATLDSPIEASPTDGPNLDECCNATSDPCCAYESCGAPLTPECSVELACWADGGSWNFGSCALPSGAGSDASSDSPFPEGGEPGDAGGG